MDLPVQSRKRARNQQHSPSNATEQTSNSHVVSSIANQQVYPSAAPSAFPTLPAGQPSQRSAALQAGRYGIGRLVEATELSDDAKIAAYYLQVDKLYNCSAFWPSSSADERKWYAQLKALTPADDLNEQINFESLYTSLRQVIIDKIRDAFPTGTFRYWYYPVMLLLGLTWPALRNIIEDNSEVWDEVPPHLAELKKLHPNEVVNEDLPPPCETVKAIRFLKQQHLPASLLGEWQFPLPEAQLFNNSALPPVQVISQAIVKPQAVLNPKAVVNPPGTAHLQVFNQQFNVTTQPVINMQPIVNTQPAANMLPIANTLPITNTQPIVNMVSINPQGTVHLQAFNQQCNVNTQPMASTQPMVNTQPVANTHPVNVHHHAAHPQAVDHYQAGPGQLYGAALRQNHAFIRVALAGFPNAQVNEHIASRRERNVIHGNGDRNLSRQNPTPSPSQSMQPLNFHDALKITEKRTQELQEQVRNNKQISDSGGNANPNNQLRRQYPDGCMPFPHHAYPRPDDPHDRPWQIPRLPPLRYLPQNMSPQMHGPSGQPQHMDAQLPAQPNEPQPLELQPIARVVPRPALPAGLSKLGTAFPLPPGALDPTPQREELKQVPRPPRRAARLSLPSSVMDFEAGSVEEAAFRLGNVPDYDEMGNEPMVEVDTMQHLDDSGSGSSFTSGPGSGSVETTSAVVGEEEEEQTESELDSDLFGDGAGYMQSQDMPSQVLN